MQVEELRAEIEKLTLELKEKDAENCIGWIINKGLPPIGPGMLNTKPSKSQMKTIDYGLVSDEIELSVLQGLDVHTNIRTSTIWINYNKKGWENETTIRNCVETALKDCIEATGSLRDLIKIAPEMTFPGVDANKKDRTDLAVLKLDNIASLIGAIEVKKPPTTSQISAGKEFNFDDAGQIVQYMYDLRASYGIRFIFGILTTYTKWRFLWFEDSHDAMMETSIEEFEKLCLKSPTLQDANIPAQIVVKKSRIYNFDDKNLVDVLRSTLFKWSLIPRDRVNGFLHKNRVYQTVNIGSKEISFELLPKELLNPNSLTCSLFKLAVYRLEQRNFISCMCIGSLVMERQHCGQANRDV